jgi:hypothetical protein
VGQFRPPVASAPAYWSALETGPPRLDCFHIIVAVIVCLAVQETLEPVVTKSGEIARVRSCPHPYNTHLVVSRYAQSCTATRHARSLAEASTAEVMTRRNYREQLLS